ncbi:MBL fold metallo-hydrolase [Pleionea sp. CnH1-48]|uniref:MBL fold metallo-hydrolase n=1 Tax=Pleionea sp. CnH1-48 TaxID=2954494 RepID=UPI0020983FFA|nr:MBL fold metallo-hydrolase [Pleionea sp. CnH1-48]MCO7224156.1 MBL fold metallo-hydrolase [Pleionea sp. CnH1-48]
MPIKVENFYHQASGTLTYIVIDQATSHCAVIDSCLDFDMASGVVSTQSAQQLVDYIDKHKLVCDWILETHAHADHLTAAQFLKDKLGAKVAIGEGITQVQKNFRAVFNLGDQFAVDGSQFDHLFMDNEEFFIGETRCRVIHVPGHTNDSVAYHIEQSVFVGDTLFMPDLGSARCDFPGGDAGELFRSIQRLYQLPDDTQLFMCHDYPPQGGDARHLVSVLQQKNENKQIRKDTSKEDYIQAREQRDQELAVPKLLYPALQVNICAGHLPAKDESDQIFLKIPVTIGTDSMR